jgi:thiamine transport system ATP-binding protein
MLTVEGVTVRFDDRVVLRDAGLHAARGEIVALLGPSGAGKSTLLRVIAGLLVPDTGRVTVDGHDVTRTPPHRRRVGLMFQNEQLFPHLDVAANVGFGLRMQRRPAAATKQRVEELLEQVGLAGFEHRRVANLSGGEAKRVALARALAADPAVLLLDEPLTGLDRELHDRLMADLATLLRAAGTTAVLVTHDRDEAATIAHRTLTLPVWQADGS